jgi:hypothetical protein
MFEMGLYDPFGYLKHNLCPKKRQEAIWFLTIKILELPWLICVEVACHTSLERSWQGLELSFKPHLNRRSAHKVMSPQSCKSPHLGNFRTPTWESWDKMTFGCWLVNTENIIRGKVVASPKSRPWWVL